jgi:site-specific DNA-methyltransferase (adenine-specific)
MINKSEAVSVLYHNHFQNFKVYQIPKAQLIIADIPYNLGNNAYASNPAWYKDGDNSNGESELAGKEFFDTDKDFRPAEFMHFCSTMLRKEDKRERTEADGFSEELSFAQFELAWTSFESTCKKFDYNTNGEGKKIHPTQKPIALYKWLLKNYAKEGDKILDTHIGSGSIAIACHDYKFDLTGCEIDLEYYEAALKRLNNHQLQTTLF